MVPTETQAAKPSPLKIILLSMPWPLFNRPSIQLGTLKSYLETNSDWLQVETAHPYLEAASILGIDMYHWISRNIWLSESLYAPLVFPEQKRSSAALAAKCLKKSGAPNADLFDYDKILEQLKNQLENWLNSYDWSQYAIIGFSVCFNQLLASLAAAGLIKKKYPRIRIVFGGSSCAAAAGKSLIDAFDWVDFVIQGEGENSLLELCRYISGQRDDIPENIFSKGVKNQGTSAPAAGSQLSSLQELPAPDYDDYFSEMNKWFRNTPFIPVIPVEFSRGCWWNKCTFCNLNLQWCGYRYKKVSQMLAEVTALSRNYGSLDFTFTDNMLPLQESLRFFSQTGKLNIDYSFFAEIRAAYGNSSIEEILSLYRSGGLSTIQVGIEALSSSLLKKMHKGTSVIDNIAIMRGACEHSLELEGNLIIRFPGSSKSEVEETLENLDYVFAYKPLTTAVFFLGNDSPVFTMPEKFGILSILDHANNRKLFPAKILKKLNLLVKDYRGDKTYQKEIWKPAHNKVKEWQEFHDNRKTGGQKKPLLGYRDGDDFLLIRQELINGTVLNHRLKGPSRQIYLYCTQIRTMEELCKRFPDIPEQKILDFLAELKGKRLIFSEEDKYLALAIQCKNY
ncbi:MAG: RiPP maturation radical SAM C-methyltransferase [Deltaproteobacteria bacterium]|nr:RiPP maturation radical SAM C-methyltransferase [Deltaproteobacteria bacterium]